MTTSEPLQHPSPSQLVWRHPAHAVSLGFGSGLWPLGPGTAGTLWGWASFLLIDLMIPSALWPGILVLALILGAWACGRTGTALGRTDHGAMVWDEIVAFWLVLSCLPRPSDPWFSSVSAGLADWQLQSLAFVLFRFFDIAKPPPIRALDALTTGGWGVMVDDLVAALFTLLSCALILRGLLFWGGL